MAITRISEHIWSVHLWLLIPIRVWLVADEREGVTLVDAGIGPMHKGVARGLERIGAGPLRRIVLTHGHSDHVGAIRPLLERGPVPVYAHAIELPYMEGDIAYPRRKQATASLAKGIARPLPEDGKGGLMPIGGLTPYWTPGHSPGHVAYYHEQDRVLLGGDLFTSKRGRLHRPMPMFTGDMQQAIASGEIVRRLRPERLEICHGSAVTLPAEQWEAYAQANRA